MTEIPKPDTKTLIKNALTLAKSPESLQAVMNSIAMVKSHPRVLQDLLDDACAKLNKETPGSDRHLHIGMMFSALMTVAFLYQEIELAVLDGTPYIRLRIPHG